MIEIPKELIAEAEALCRKAYERGWYDATDRFMAAAVTELGRAARSRVDSTSPAKISPVSKRKPPIGAPRWTRQETDKVSPYRHLRGEELATIPYEMLEAQLPGRSRKAIQDKIGSLRERDQKAYLWAPLKDNKHPAKQNSAPPSTGMTPVDGQRPSEAEIVDEKAAGVYAPGQVTEHHVDGAEDQPQTSLSVVDPKIIGRPSTPRGSDAAVYPEPEPIPLPSRDKLMGSR